MCQKACSDTSWLAHVSRSVQPLAEPASVPVVAKGVQRGWGTVWVWRAPRCATSLMSAATPVPSKNVMSQYSLLFISFTLLTLHCHTHCWLGWVNTKRSAVCIVYWHLTPPYDMLILLHTTKSSFRSQKAYKFLSTPWSEWVYMISRVQKEEFGILPGSFSRLKLALANVMPAWNPRKPPECTSIDTTLQNLPALTTETQTKVLKGFQRKLRRIW